MGRNSFLLSNDHRELFDALPPDKAGLLIQAIFSYESGEKPDLPDDLRIVFIPIRQWLDKNREAYKQTCEVNSKNGALGGRPKKRTVFKETQKSERFFEKAKKADNDLDLDLDSENDSEHEKIKVLSPAAREDIFAGRSFSPNMRAKLTEWLQYKAERRESYKPTGLTIFLKKAEEHTAIYSEEAVIGIINDSMASNYQGVVWDRLKGREQKQVQPTSRYKGVTQEI